MIIATDYGNFSTREFYYDGVFENGLTYNINSCTTTHPQDISILYARTPNVIVGDVVFSNGKARLRMTSDTRQKLVIIDESDPNIEYTLLDDSIGGGRFVILITVHDNNNKVAIFGLSTFASPYEASYENVILPTADHFGYCTAVGQNFSGQSFVYRDNVHEWLTGEVPTDPYNPGGETETGGGEGDFDNTSDPIPEASLPTLSAVDAKFISLYTPTLAELQSLANYMWSPLFDIDTLKKMFADPMKVILGLSIVPFAVPSSGQQTITIGNISTGVSMTKASAQYIQIDCGTLNVNEYWGAYLDYSPYTKLEIYLPYIGTKQISVDDVMNKACHVYYNVDILTGACCAMIKCDDSVLYSYAGQCATSLPITGSDWTNVVSGAISVALSTAAYYAGGQTSPLTDAGALHTLSSSSQTIMQMKPTIEKTGSIAGSAGMLGVQSPYLILTRPRQALPNNQNHFTGYPSYVNVKLGDLTGMTFVEQVHLENIPCTSSEQSEIETLLKGGVIF